MTETLGFFKRTMPTDEEGSTIDLTFKGVTLESQEIFQQESGTGEYLAQGLVSLLTPISKQKLDHLEIKDYDFDTKEMVTLDLTPEQKLLRIIPEGIWGASFLMFYLQSGDESKAKEALENVRGQSLASLDNALKKKVAETTGKS